MTRAEKQTRVRKRLIETARPELIDATRLLLEDLDGFPSGIPRGVLAYALAKAGTPERVVELRQAWLGSAFYDSFLVYVIKQTR